MTPREWLRNSCQPLTDPEGSGFVGSRGGVLLPLRAVQWWCLHISQALSLPQSAGPVVVNDNGFGGHPDDVNLMWLAKPQHEEAAGPAPHWKRHSNLPKVFRLKIRARSERPRHKTPAGSTWLLKLPVCDPALVPRPQRSPVCEVGCLLLEAAGGNHYSLLRALRG